jgi:hypothetical protein
MRILRILTPLCLLLSFVLISTASAEMSSASYRITSTVMSGGGGTMSSASYQLAGTLGQPSPLGSSSSASFAIEPGFWHTLLLIMVGDVNGDGVLGLDDVIIALQVATGMTPDELTRQADADGDGRIGLVEAIWILGELGD